MARATASRVIGMWTRTLLDEVAPEWRTKLDLPLVDPVALRSTDPYIPHEDMITLWSHFTAHHADPLFGIHFAERHCDRAVGLYAYAAAHAPDFVTGARACLQVQRLIDTHSDITMLDRDDGGIALRHVPPKGIVQWPRHLIESLSGGCIFLSRKFTGVPAMAPVEAHFQHASDGVDVSAWFGCPVKHGCEANLLAFDRATLELPFTHADATQFAAIMAAAARILDTIAPPDTILGDVRAALRTHKGKRVSIAVIARALKVSERTLQRRLSEAGMTFRELHDEVRVEQLAEHGIDPPKAQVTASALGFADPSSLRRLRKRWRKR